MWRHQTDAVGLIAFARLGGLADGLSIMHYDLIPIRADGSPATYDQNTVDAPWQVALERAEDMLHEYSGAARVMIKDVAGTVVAEVPTYRAHD
jgi:hypothetical protein